MAPEVLTIEGNPALPGFWPSIATASAQIRRRRRTQRGRMQSWNPAVPGLTPPALGGRRGSDPTGGGQR